MKKTLTILGIDPGFARTGWGVIVWQSDQLTAVDYGCLETTQAKQFSVRLKYLYNQLRKIIKKFKPDFIAVEEVFFYKNLKTAIKVSHARGVILLLAEQQCISLVEFTPLQIKQAISSYGRADKRQVQEMVKTLLGLSEVPQPDDAADALAVALCLAHSLTARGLLR